MSSPELLKNADYANLPGTTRIHDSADLRGSSRHHIRRGWDDYLNPRTIDQIGVSGASDRSVTRCIYVHPRQTVRIDCVGPIKAPIGVYRQLDSYRGSRH